MLIIVAAVKNRDSPNEFLFYIFFQLWVPSRTKATTKASSRESKFGQGGSMCVESVCAN